MKSGSVFVVFSVALLAVAMTVQAQPPLVIEEVLGNDIRIYDDQFEEQAKLSAEKFRSDYIDKISVVTADGQQFDGDGLEVEEVNSSLLMYRVLIALDGEDKPNSYWVEGPAFKVFPADKDEAAEEVCPAPVPGLSAANQTQEDITTGFGGCIPARDD